MLWKILKRKPVTKVATELSEEQIQLISNNTGCDREMIQEEHQKFLLDCPDGIITKELFLDMYKRLYPRGDPTSYCQYAFRVFDQNKNGTIEFEEFLISLMVTRKRPEHQLALAFSFYDNNKDGVINEKELSNVISAVYELIGNTNPEDDRSPKKLAAKIIATIDINGDKKISKSEFIAGCKTNEAIRRLLVPNVKWPAPNQAEPVTNAEDKN